MKLTSNASLLAVLILATVTGCVERGGPDVQADAGWDLRTMNRYRSGGGCHLLGCQPDLLRIVVDDFFGRFLSVSRSLDVEICYAATCSTAQFRAERDGGPFDPQFPSTRDYELTQSINPPKLDPGATVRVKITIPSGRTLLEEEVPAREETYCPNGYDCPAPCPIRRAVFRAPTDAGQPADADPDPYRQPIDRACTPPRPA